MKNGKMNLKKESLLLNCTTCINATTITTTTGSLPNLDEGLSKL